MKKYLILLVGLLALFMISCSDSDSSDDKVTIYQLPDFNDYTFRIYASAEWNTISVYSDGDVTIDSLYVMIDGVAVTFDREAAYYNFVEGQTYNIDVTVNGAYHQAVDLEIVCTPEISFPDSLEAGVDITLEWDLDINAKTQYLYFDNYIDDTYYPYMTYFYLEGSQRCFTMDAETFNLPSEPWMRIELSENNWITQGEFIFLSYATIYKYY